MVNKPEQHHPMPEDWTMFVGIAAFRDIHLIMTLKALVRLAEHPERLHISILNDVNVEDDAEV